MKAVVYITLAGKQPEQSRLKRRPLKVVAADVARQLNEGKVLRGVPQNAPQWQLAQRFVDYAMGEAVGKLYVPRYFPPENKRRVQAMVDNTLAAFRDGISELAWMGPQSLTGEQRVIMW